MSFKLKPLPFLKDSLEPFMSAKTFDFHHGKHHAAYVNKLNELIKGTEFEYMHLEQIVTSINITPAIFNNAAQIWNHDFLWQSMKPNGGGKPTEKLYSKIVNDFVNFEEFLVSFKNYGMTQFGSGWVWLVYNLDTNKLSIIKTANADTPIAYGSNHIPLLTVDVWEHAYYLDYQNLRNKYLDVFFSNIVNWDFASQNFEKVV